MRLSFDSKPIAKALDTLGRKAMKKPLRDAVDAGGKVVLSAAKAKAPAETKALQKALGHRIKSYAAGLRPVAIVGARKGFARQITRTFTKKGAQRLKARRLAKKEKAAGEVRDPANYLHLVEGGRRAISGLRAAPVAFRGRGGKLIFTRRTRAAEGRFFMRAAWLEAKAQAASTTLDKLATSAKEALKAAGF